MDHHPDQPPSGASESVLRSWRRCIALGLSHHSPLEAPGRMGESPSLPFLLPLLNALEPSLCGHSTVLVATDSQGWIQHMGGDRGLMCRLAGAGFAPGTCWHEEFAGTNAIGLALLGEGPMSVRGEEHFLRAMRRFNAYGIPFLLGSDVRMGVIALVSDQAIQPGAAIGLLKQTANLMENRLVSLHREAAVVIHFAASGEVLDSPNEGIACFDREGRLIACNRHAESMFSAEFSGTLTLQGWSGMDVPTLIRHAGTWHPAPCRLGQSPHKGWLARCMTMHAGRDRIDGAAEKPSPPESAFAALDLGDLRMAEAVRRATRISGFQIPLLIQGETGTGKEVFALAYHRSGPRRQGPFVAINCASIPATLIEAELFGYVEGAYTGARREGAPGRLRDANGGTLFLDEIGDMPLQLQAVLLRVLETRQVPPLGGGAEEAIDISIVCASHRPLRELVESGQFRRDLLFRLSGMTITLPPLRERSDFNAIVRKILGEESGSRRLRISSEALTILRKLPWPGNIRQLRNVLKVSLAQLGRPGDELSPDHLPGDLLDDIGRQRVHPAACSLRASETRLVQDAVSRHGGNISAAARELGITRTTLYRKLRQD